MSKPINKKRFKRIINSYILAQDDPVENLDILQRYFKKKGLGKVNKDLLKKEIRKQLKERKEEKLLLKVESRLFKRDDEVKKYRYGSGFCPNCDMYKDYHKECPYCGKLEMTF